MLDFDLVLQFLLYINCNNWCTLDLEIYEIDLFVHSFQLARVRASCNCQEQLLNWK